MRDASLDEIQATWNAVADDWQLQVGEHGDNNRRLNSDPILWAFLGDVSGKRVLDAGCGTGYLTRHLHDKGAHVTGIDLSERMLEIARASRPDLDFRQDSCTDLHTLTDASFDAIVANYVLMDVPDLSATLHAFHRVLKPNGIAVVVFSHPCFPQGDATLSENSQQLTYVWNSSYFQPLKRIDPPWAHFKSEFIWFHRPLSDYWKAFRGAGFQVIDFEEPRLTEERFHLTTSEKQRLSNQLRPISVVFKLKKGG